MFYYRLINFLRRLLWKHPRLYRPFGWWRRGIPIFDRDCDLVLEGYPRSANTFVVELLKLTQPRLRVLSHRHIPAYVISTVRTGRPLLFLIRCPVDCVASYAILKGTSAIRQLVYYVAYHRVLEPYVDQMFIADFDVVTSDPIGVLEQFGHRYHLRFDLDFDPEEARQQVFDEIDRLNTSVGGQINERKVNRPSASRMSEKLALIKEMERPENRLWLDQANALNAAFRAKAVSIPPRVTAC